MIYETSPRWKTLETLHLMRNMVERLRVTREDGHLRFAECGGVVERASLHDDQACRSGCSCHEVRAAFTTKIARHNATRTAVLSGASA